jgi:ABC-type antimicrobial peptide transport system permease subunit
MKFIDLFKLSTRMFKARTSRTLLTILGMSVGISAILFLVSLGYGLQKTLLERITTSDSLLTLDVTEAKSGDGSLSADNVNQIKSLPGVSEVSSSFEVPAQGKTNDLSADLTLVGTDSAFLRLSGTSVEVGNNLDDNNQEGIVISSAVSQVFGKSDADMIGQQMTFSVSAPEADNSADNQSVQEESQKIDLGKTFKIIGVIQTDDNIVYMDASALSVLNVSEFSQLKVKCSSTNVMNQVRDTLSSRGLVVSSLSDTIDQANKVFRVVQIVLMLFGIIALVVSAIGMFNTMTIALLERTEEIGIMKSIGASDFGVSVMFIMESTIMGFFGGLGGILIGFVGGQVINFLINIIAHQFGGQSVSLFYSPLWFIFTIMLFAAFVGMMTGIVPAQRASKVDPLDALRYK